MIRTSRTVDDVPSNGLTGPAPRQVIIEETAGLCAQVYNSRLRAIVLTGSVARDEGTFVHSAEGITLLGDAEFFVVFHDAFMMPAAADLKVIEGKIQERLRRRGIVANVTLSGIQSRYFRGVRPSIFGYELRTCGVVAWGDPEILQLIPSFGSSDIPLEDGWRLLANRLVEQLEGFDDLTSGRPALSTETQYRTMKLFLDMGTSLLVFTGGYAPTYAERAAALLALKSRPENALPFPQDTFVRDVLAATRWKLDGTAPRADCSPELWQRAIGYAERLWSWELSRMTNAPPDSSETDLLRAWLQRQPMATRLRGWAHVARRQGVRGSLARWPRWLRSAMNASPRYLVYSVAAPLVFTLRDATITHDHNLAGDLSGLQRRLPVTAPRRGAANRLDARQAVSLVLENYRQFLVGTRA